MPTYGLKYQSQFDSQTDANNPSKRYTIQFLFKDYSGGTTSISGAETSVIQKCTVDDPVAPIKGQSLSINLLNKGNSLPITAFQSEDDDGVQVKLLGNSNEVLFIGFLVQDDFYEPMVDYPHAIQLSANDGLGLLKGVVLSDASVRRAYMVTFITLSPSQLDNLYIFTNDTAFDPAVGSTIEIQGIVYAIEASQPVQVPIGSVMYNWLIRINPDGPLFAQTTEVVYIAGVVNLLNRNSLLTIIAVCLAQTNLALITNIFMNLYEYRQDNTISTFEQTLIDSQLWISGEAYMSCYDVLWSIMRDYDCSLKQANGQWNITHWQEAKRYANNAIPGFVYDEGWIPIGTTVFNNNFFIGPDPQLTRPTFQLTQGALRGYKFSRKQFDYRQPKYLLRNYDLLLLGDLIRTYVDGAFTFTEYTAIGWTTGVGPTLAERFIRVIIDNGTGTEVGRLLVIRGPNSNTTRAMSGEPFEVSLGDKLKFSFSFRTNISQGGPVVIVFSLMLTDGTTSTFVENDQSWSTTGGYTVTIPGGDNTDQWHSVEIQSSPTPFAGHVYCYLAIATDAPFNSTRETQYRDIRLENEFFINESLKVIGHAHKQERPTGPKLFSDNVISIDDSPRNSIVGTLFLTSKTGLLQDRTLYWRYPPDANGWKLGELTTLEELTWRQKTRSKLEGGFIGNYQTVVISLLTMVITDFNTAKNYVPGLMTIDYKRNQFSCTLWELYDTTDGEFDPEYLFKYIYSTA